jgi:hypothetical protein
LFLNTDNLARVPLTSLSPQGDRLLRTSEENREKFVAVASSRPWGKLNPSLGVDYRVA